MAVTPDGRRVVSSNGNEVLVWDAATGERLRQLGERGRSNWALAVSSDGRRAIGGDDRTDLLSVPAW